MNRFSVQFSSIDLFKIKIKSVRFLNASIIIVSYVVICHFAYKYVQRCRGKDKFNKM